MHFQRGGSIAAFKLLDQRAAGGKLDLAADGGIDERPRRSMPEKS